MAACRLVHSTTSMITWKRGEYHTLFDSRIVLIISAGNYFQRSTTWTDWCSSGTLVAHSLCPSLYLTLLYDITAPCCIIPVDYVRVSVLLPVVYLLYSDYLCCIQILSAVFRRCIQTSG